MKDSLTVAMPIYERSDYFEQALNSVLTQTVLPTSVIIVDDASSHTGFRDIVERLNNPIITYYRNEVNLNLGGNFNQCIKHCTTDWLTILHDDDMLHPQFVEFFYKSLESKKGQMDAIVFGSQVGEVCDFSQPVTFVPPTTRVTRKTFLFGTITPFPGVVFRPDPKILFERKHYPSEDIFFWYSMVAHGYRFYQVPTVLTFYRISPQQMSSWSYKEITQKIKELLDTYIVSRWNPAERYIANHTLRRVELYYDSRYDPAVFRANRSLAFRLGALFSRAYKKLVVDLLY